ncbi:MAG TPA: putative toxin-antitoxin system toxin component, PIN family [Lacipirellulaceae bacterium]|nr:putative toxin-antitoxin system toxin component, PIN family [Lacipirellulaceae bacterium]
MSATPRVVFDCNVLLQALISQYGPSFAAVDAARKGQVRLFLSEQVITELRSVAVRPRLADKFRLTDAKVDKFVAGLREHSHWLTVIPHVFDFPRDPTDAHYIDLAVAADAHLIVSRDADLLSLADATTPDGRDFSDQFPTLRILTPPQLLIELER